MSNGIQFNTLSLKNFLSFGAQLTEIDLRGDFITAVLGLNHDTGGDESRNGVGKSAIIDAVSYALFGKTVRGISNAKLVNKLMRKGQGMLVVLEFNTPSGSYRIERGEAPAKLRLFRKDLDDSAEFLTRDGKTFVYDISRNKVETTAEIEKIIGFDIKLFSFLIANSSESDAFMKMSEDEKRKIAERLMGLNILSERAEELKEDRKDRKKELVAVQSALEATKQANDRIEGQLAQISGKEKEWEAQRKSQMQKLEKSIQKLEGVDTDLQLEILQIIGEVETEEARIAQARKDSNVEMREARRDLKTLNDEIDSAAERFKELGRQKQKIEASECPTCHQHWVADPSVLQEIDDEINTISEFSESSVDMLTDAEKVIVDVETKVSALDDDEKATASMLDEIADIDLLFDSEAEVLAVEKDLARFTADLEEIEKSENPHTETIAGMRKDAIKQVDDTEARELNKLINHYNYLIDLLQSKDSFLRKAVIDRWLPRLNGRIAHYLDTLELPYTVRIENDLSMSISDFGEEFDWGNLSKGQRQRVTIALNLAFQDLFEATNHPLSLLMVDELIDSGICNRGASQAVKALQETADSKGKRVFLITHRMDVADVIDDVMYVEMKNRISRIEEDNLDE